MSAPSVVLPPAPVAQEIGDPLARIEAAAERIASTQLERSELQFRQAFLAERIRRYEGLEQQIVRARRQLLDQSRQLEAQLPRIFWPKRVEAVQAALKTHAQEHGPRATADLFGRSPESFGPLRGVPLSPTRRSARETAREAALRLSSLHGTRHRLGELRELASSRPHLDALRAEFVDLSRRLGKLPSVPGLHHHLARSIEHAGGLPAVVSRLSPSTLALAEKALALGRSLARGNSR